MKVRKGFVSNSSSSSFIVAFTKVPETAEELRNMLFEDEEMYHGYNHCYPTSQVAETVFADMESPLDDDALIEEFQNGHIDGCPRFGDFDNFDNCAGKTDWKAYQSACYNFAKKMAIRFKDNNPKATFFQFEYHDNDGNYGSDLEHGDLFKNMRHEKISHH